MPSIVLVDEVIQRQVQFSLVNHLPNSITTHIAGGQHDADILGALLAQASPLSASD